ncbi:adenosine deaminase AGSA-like isoform X2 [Spodoptera frugiperda]|uniref:Adenosine deaminase n=1 Tax=Spodoptera frugiperda TaxID=7108 RepID=A0A9R0DT06_SPOFR|nr:adenosine deaminase AGSA-like isoform X2 [Spodoptera frugiperda]
MWLLTIILLPNILIVTSQIHGNILHERETLIEKELKMMVGHSIELSDSELEANEIIMDLKREEIDYGFWNPKYYNLSKHFFEYKDLVKDTKLYKIIKSMPKGALLHGHGKAMHGPDYVLELTYCDDLWICFKEDQSDVSFIFSKHYPAGCCETKWERIMDIRRTTNVTEFDAKLRKFFTLVIDNPQEVYTDVNTVWEYFDKYFTRTGPLIKYKPVWEKYYYDMLLALREDNVMYFEIRSGLPSLYDLEGITYSSVDTAKIYERLTEKFKNDYPDFFGAKLIYAPERSIDRETLRNYIKIAKEIHELMPDFLAGFDLVGQEDLGKPLKEFYPELANISLNLYFHAGETNWYGTSTDENLFDAILLGTKRIGHAFALVKHPLLMKEVQRRKIALEMNVISNVVLKLVDDVRNHPLATYLSQDMPVVLSSDDPGPWEAEILTHDFYVAFVGVSSRHADLKMLKQLALNSLYHSSYSEKHNLVHEFQIRWTKFIDSIVKDQWVHV